MTSMSIPPDPEKDPKSALHVSSTTGHPPSPQSSVIPSIGIAPQFKKVDATTLTQPEFDKILAQITEIVEQRSQGRDSQKGFIRPTYEAKEYEDFLKKGYTYAIPSSKGDTVGAFVIILPGENSSLASENFALKLFQTAKLIPYVCKKALHALHLAGPATKSWDDRHILHRNDILYVAQIVAAKGEHISSESLRILLNTVSREHPSRKVVTTISSLPVPNKRMEQKIKELDFTFRGNFSLLIFDFLGRPGRDGTFLRPTKWIGGPYGKTHESWTLNVFKWGRWRSAIYLFDGIKKSEAS